MNDSSKSRRSWQTRSVEYPFGATLHKRLEYLDHFKCIRLLCAFVSAIVLLSESPRSLAQTSAPRRIENREPETAWLERLGSRGIRVHDPSTIVRCKDEYWCFYTGWGIASWHSKDLVHWERGPQVFTNPPPWVTKAVPLDRGGMSFWAPDIIHLSNRYLLYFSASSWGKNTSAIGLATNPTLDPNDPNYHWTDDGIVIQSNPEKDFNTIDPAVIQDADGKLWLSFGSFWSGIRMIQLNPETGKRIAPDSPVYSLAHSEKIEASYVYHHDGFYYLFVNWGQCCRGTNSTYNIRVGRSEQITGPYLDRNNHDLLRGGGSLILDRHGPFIGPGHAGIFSNDGAEWLSCHFYDGTRRGMPTLAILPLKWTADGWPEVAIPPKE